MQPLAQFHIPANEWVASQVVLDDVAKCPYRGRERGTEHYL